MTTYKETEFLKFTEVETKGKTKQLFIYNKNNDWLGHINWFNAWRRYTFTPFTGTTFDVKCLNEITTVINELMEERKK